MDNLEPDVAYHLEDESSPKEVEALYPLVADIQAKFDLAKTSRHTDEQRWIKAYYNYRGNYLKNIQFTETEKSRVFLKVTKTKVLAAYGQLMDTLFPTGALPLAVEPTDVPLGIEEAVHVDLDDPMGEPELDPPEDEPLPDLIGFEGDGRQTDTTSLRQRIGAWLATKLEGAKVKSGPGTSGKHVTYRPAEEAAKRMEKKILDQLYESKAVTHLRRSAFESALLGSGVVKGPFAEDKEYARWDQMGVYKPVMRTVPKVEHVSLWHFYIDPEASNLFDANWTIQRHKLTKSGMRKLKRRPFFRGEEIDRAIEDGFNWQRLWWETEINDSQLQDSPDRFEVLEYWGTVDREYLEEHDVDLPEDLHDYDEFQANVWICGSRLLRVVLNPFTPARIPYLLFPYEENPYSPYGVGVAENMEDTQTLMNGFVRLAVDNAVLSGNMMLEVDEDALVPGQDMKLYPGKIWRRQAGPAGQAIHSIKFENVSQEVMMMFDRMRQLADESTGLPSYSHGHTGVQATNRTAAGVSMLMGAAHLNIRTVVKNIDDYLLKPLGEAMYAFNMQFLPDPKVQGDLEVKAKGTSSLMQREIKSQRLIQFIQIMANPLTAPRVNFAELIREVAISMDLDPDKVVLSEEEALLAARLFGQQNMQMNPGDGMGMGQEPGNPAGVPTPSDQSGTGGGNMGVGAPAMPGSEQFSGSPTPPAPGGGMNGR